MIPMENEKIALFDNEGNTTITYTNNTANVVLQVEVIFFLCSAYRISTTYGSPARTPTPQQAYRISSLHEGNAPTATRIFGARTTSTRIPAKPPSPPPTRSGSIYQIPADNVTFQSRLHEPRVHAIFSFFPRFFYGFFSLSYFFFSFLFFATRRRAQNSNSSNISVRISAISLAILPHRRGIRRKACTFLRRCAALVFRPATKLESRLRRNSFYAVRTPVEDAGGTWCGNRAAGWRWVGCGIFVRRTAPTGTRVLRPLA